MENPRPSRWKAWAGGIVIGAALVLCAAAGMKYSDTRPLCSSCHVMEPAALLQTASSHADLACNECHAPQNLVDKIPFKAKEGLRDFIGNLSGKDVPLRSSAETRSVINANCISCHRVTTENVMMSKEYCFDCHRNVAHQKKNPISFREAADE